jgi:hypothetical protein
MVKIGQRDLMNYYSLLIPKGSATHIPVEVNGWTFDLEIQFDNASDDKGVDITPSDGGVRIVFRKWDNVLGTALTEPVTLATLQDGRKLAFMASNYAIGTTNKLDLQLLLQGQ